MRGTCKYIFYPQVYKERGYTNIEIGEWGADKKRTIRFTLAPSSLASASGAEEHQTVVVDAEVCPWRCMAQANASG